MQNTPLFTREQKYRLALFGILVMSSLISVGLFAARATPSPKGPYTSLLLNLLLAWIPLGFASIATMSTRLPKTPRRVLVVVCAIFWLIFFPNALYILTDFQHLAIRDTATPVWYDVLMLLWFAWSGLFLGLISMYLMQKVIMRWLGKIYSWFFVIGATSLGSLGVYMGRFYYWNSWDVILNPFSMPRKVLENFSYLEEQERSLSFSFPLALFFLFVYVTFYIFGRLTNEYDNQG